VPAIVVAVRRPRAGGRRRRVPARCVVVEAIADVARFLPRCVLAQWPRSTRRVRRSAGASGLNAKEAGRRPRRRGDHVRTAAARGLGSPVCLGGSGCTRGVLAGGAAGIVLDTQLAPSRIDARLAILRPRSRDGRWRTHGDRRAIPCTRPDLPVAGLGNFGRQ
jgi:hypothetical protein